MTACYFISALFFFSGYLYNNCTLLKYMPNKNLYLATGISPYHFLSAVKIIFKGEA